MTTQHTWRKSSRSANTDNCVEVRGSLDAVRDSKNPEGGAVEVDLDVFLTAVKAGRFDA